MSTLLKTLNEQRGAKLKKAQSITEKAGAEARGLSDEERNELRGLNDEIAKIDEDLTEEVRNIGNLSKRTPELSQTEERDIARFDISKLLRHMDRVHRGQPSTLDGIEAEMLQEGEKEARGARVETRGMVLPEIIVRRQGIDGRENRDLSVTGGTTTQYGGELVATEKVGLLDDFYNSSVMIQGGAMVLNGLTGNVDLPRYNAATDPAKKAENAAADELSPTFTSLSLSPKRLPAVIDISDQLIAQSSAPLMAFLRSALRSQLGAVQEKAFWHGGGTNEPTGVAGTSGIGDVEGGTNGSAADWADMIDLETAVAVDDALIGNLHYVTNSAVRGKLKQTVRVSSTDSMFIWDDRAGNMINGYSPLVTNAVSSSLTKGSASGVCSAIFFGNLADFVVGYWGGLDLEIVTDKTLRAAGQRALVANVYYDAGVLRAESFAAKLDTLTA